MKPTGKPFLRKHSSKRSYYDEQRENMRSTLQMFGSTGPGRHPRHTKRHSSSLTSSLDSLYHSMAQKEKDLPPLNKAFSPADSPGLGDNSFSRSIRIPDIVINGDEECYTRSSPKCDEFKKMPITRKSRHLEEVERGLDQKRKSANIHRLKRQRRRLLLLDKWKRVVRMFCIFYRTWKLHSNRVTDILDQFDSLDMIVNAKDSKQDLLFDLSDYKAQKEAQITQEAKRVLKLPPGTRTEKELHNVRVALRNYPSLMEYPVHMQRLMTSRAWYECYDSKRVIIREGHAPMNFYFILTGSVLVSKYDHDKKANKTLCFLARGDNFGENAILDKTTREYTVISKEKVELFCISDEDYMSIFMAGGLNDPHDPFLQSISCLRGWPTQYLVKNQQKAVFAYFRRKTVLAEDTSKSDWIFIVKSGSACLMKQLKKVEPNTGRRVPRKKKKKSAINPNKSHEEQMEERLQLTIKAAQEHQTLLHQLNLPEINIATLPTYTRKHGKTEDDKSSRASSSLTLSHLRTFTPTASPLASPLFSPSSPHPLTADSTASAIRFNFDFAPRVPSPFITKAATAKNPPVSIMVTTDDTPPRRLSLIPPPSPPPAALSPIPEVNTPAVTPLPRIDHRKLFSDAPHSDDEDEEPVFVVVQTLTKGSVFGLADIVYGHQPSFSLVSNGAEIIKINKKLYVDHADQRVMTRLREEIYPYPTDDELQEQLSTRVSWDANRMECLFSTLQNLKVKHSDLGDARTSLRPAVI